MRDHRREDTHSPVRFEHDQVGEEHEPPMPGLYISSIEHMKGPPIYFDRAKAELVLQQFQETAKYRQWELRAVAIMCSHFHLLVRVHDELDPDKLLGDFKAYGSRVLNRTYGPVPSETWWTRDGSKRKVDTDAYFANVVHYVLYEQELPLVVYGSAEGRVT